MMNDYVPTKYQKKAFRAVEYDYDGVHFLERTSQPFPTKFVDKAFQYSIAKWTVVCELLEQNINLVSCGEDKTCALCALSGPGCKGCPISIYTGKPGCSDTPYTSEGWFAGEEQRLANAQEELAFLQKVYRWWMMRGH